jgi:hypothetical protein
MRVTTMNAQFVEFIPEKLDEGVLYISRTYNTAAHLCCCGCGTEIVTPLTPTDWKLSINGGQVSLSPSIGNWGLPCRSHYLIRANRIIPAGSMSPHEIDRGRAYDRANKAAYYGSRKRGFFVWMCVIWKWMLGR